jgi:hypothetical protein
VYQLSAHPAGCLDGIPGTDHQAEGIGDRHYYGGSSGILPINEKKNNN